MATTSNSSVSFEETDTRHDEMYKTIEAWIDDLAPGTPWLRGGILDPDDDLRPYEEVPREGREVVHHYQLWPVGSTGDPRMVDPLALGRPG